MRGVPRRSQCRPIRVRSREVARNGGYYREVMNTLSADVIVVGGGSAGCSAALRMRELGIEPLLISKGLVGKSGCSIFAGALIVGGTMLDSTPVHASASIEFFVKYYSQYLVDQSWLKGAGAWIEEVFYPELDEAGLYFRRDDQGTIVTSIGPVRWLCAISQGQSGILLMDRRRKQIAAAGVDTLEEAAVTAFLTDDHGAVAGVVALHLPTGDLHAVRASAVVLATGHADRLTKRATGTREQSADGIALAYRAGAELVNLEMQYWHSSDLAHPNCWQRAHMYPNPLVGTAETSRMINADGEVFFDLAADAPVSLAPYALQQKRLLAQVRAGKARFDGGYYASYAHHADPGALKAYQYNAKALARFGYDIATDRMETASSWHYRQGGVLADSETMETAVPGLYVAGGVGGHVTGSVAVAAYDGHTVAETLAGRGVAGGAPPSLPTAQVEIERKRLEALRRPLNAGAVTPMHVKKALWEVMWEHMGYVKTAGGMEEALARIAALRERASGMGLRATTRRYNSGWLDAVDVHNMLDACEATVRSALNRTESRGPFYRADFPVVDNRNWMVKNILRRCDGRVAFRTEPYDTAFMKPEFETRDYFAVDW